MKIALVCPYNMFEKAGGVGEVVVNLQKGLVKKGHEVKIITPRPAKFEGAEPAGYIFLGNSRKMKAYLATSGDVGIEIDGKEIEEVLLRERFDVINFHEPWLPHLSKQIIQRSSAAHVSTFHASLADSLAGNSLLNMTSLYWRVILAKTQIITAVSEAASSGLVARQSDKALVRRIRYIPNGIDLHKYQTKPKNAVKHPNMKTIFYVGRLEGRKGLKYLLVAFKNLTDRCDDVQLLIAGSGPDEQKLRDFVSEQEIPRVTFLGYITDEDKIYHLHKADVFCSAATKGESFGIVLLEAMAASCPIVAGDNVGYQSVMQGTGAISLVNPRDTVDFSRRLEIMLMNQDLRNVWLRWAKHYIRQFDYKKIIDQYEAAYREAMRIHAGRTKEEPKSRFSLRRQPR